MRRALALLLFALALRGIGACRNVDQLPDGGRERGRDRAAGVDGDPQLWRPLPRPRRHLPGARRPPRDHRRRPVLTLGPTPPPTATPAPTPTGSALLAPGAIPANPDTWTGTPPAGDDSTPGALAASCDRTGLSLTRLVISGQRVRAYGVTRYATETPILVRDAATGASLASGAVDTFGRFELSFPTAKLKTGVGTAKLYAQSYGVRSRALRLLRGNDLDVVSQHGGTLLLRGVLGQRYREGTMDLKVFGGRNLAGCRRAKSLKLVGKPAWSAKTGRYALRVRAPKGTGYLVVRVRAEHPATGATYSGFAVR